MDLAATAAMQIPGTNDPPTAPVGTPYGAPHGISIDPSPTAVATATPGSGLPPPAPSGRGRGALVGGIIVLVLVLALGGGMVAGKMTSADDAAPTPTTEDDDTTTRPRSSSTSTSTSTTSTSTSTSSTTTTTRPTTTTTTRAASSTTARVSTTAKTTTNSSISSGVGLEQWTVMFSSLDVTTITEARAQTELAKVRGVVSNARMATSNEIPSLHPGYYVIYATGFSSSSSALSYCESLLPQLQALNPGDQQSRDLCYASYFSSDTEGPKPVYPA